MTTERRPNFDLDWSKHLARSSRICVFVGAGVSSGCFTQSKSKPPNWDQLVRILADEYGCASIASDDRLQILEKAELIDRARKEKSVGNYEFATQIANHVDNISGEFVEESGVHRTIRDINPELIITTNYDRIIERYLNGSTEPGYNVWTYPGRIEQIAPTSSCSQTDKLGDLVRSGDPFIIKVHGGVPSTDVESGDNRVVNEEEHGIVFSYSSYVRAYGPDSEIPALLRAVFSTYQVIFVGYSLRDQVLRDILQGVGTLKGSRFRHIILQSPDSVVPNVYQEAFENSYGVAIGTYSDHDKLAAGLHGLKLVRP